MIDHPGLLILIHLLDSPVSDVPFRKGRVTLVSTHVKFKPPKGSLLTASIRKTRYGWIDGYIYMYLLPLISSLSCRSVHNRNLFGQCPRARPHSSRLFFSRLGYCIIEGERTFYKRELGKTNSFISMIIFLMREMSIFSAGNKIVVLKKFWSPTQDL